jgi:glucokinase
MAKGILQHRDFIVDYVRRNQPVSRLQIAREFEMHASTVGNIVDALIADGLVMETDESRQSPSAGRPPRFLRVNPHAGAFVGIDLYDGLFR